MVEESTEVDRLGCVSPPGVIGFDTAGAWLALRVLVALARPDRCSALLFG
jgi:hypothetical protein